MRSFPFDLCAMHDAPRIRIEGIAPVQHREIVPHEQIANLPFMIHGESLLRGMRPQCIKHLLAVGYIHADDVAVRPTAKEHRLASGFWIGAHQRVTAPTVSRTSVTSLYPLRRRPALLREASWTATLPSIFCFSAAGKAS